MLKKFIYLPLLCFSLSVIAQQPHQYKKEIIPIKLERISPPLRSINHVNEHPVNRTVKENETEEHREVKFKKNYIGIGADKAIQRIYADSTGTVLTMLDNLEGLDESVDPSDNTLAVSPDYVVQMTNNWNNSAIRIWDKDGSLVIPELNTEDVSGLNDYGDPNIIYDEAADRFAFVLLAFSGSKLILCISQTNDPAGAYYVYSFSPGFGFPDYPKLAVWKDSYFITTNSSDPAIFALNRTALLAGEDIGIIQKYTLDGFSTIGFQAPAPVTQTGSLAPAADEPAIILRIADEAWSGIDSDYLEYTEVDIRWDDPDLSSISEPHALSIIPYDSYLCGFGSWHCIPQPGTSQKLDPLADIIMDKSQYRNFGDHASIVCSTVSNADGDSTAGVRWFELRKSAGEDWQVYQQSTYSPDDNYRWMSSISMNQFGSIALAYNISSSEVYPGIRMTGRTYCDSLNKMTAAEINAQSGTGSNSNERYGDYNALVTDPVDGTFWFTSNYNPGSSWKTRVIHFALDTCGYIPSDTTIDTSVIDTNTLVLQGLLTHFGLQPIPADDHIDISFGAAFPSKGSVVLYDISGHIIRSKEISIREGENDLMLPVADLPQGHYIIKLLMEQGSESRKCIISH